MATTDARSQPTDTSEPASPLDLAHGNRNRGLATMARTITTQEWCNILFRVYQGVIENRILLVAAGVTFYLILALFPGIAALVSVYGLFVDPRSMVQHLGVATRLAPAGAVGLLREQLTRLAQQSGTTLGLSFLASLTVSCWTAASGFKAIFEGLNVAYGEVEKRSYLRLTATALVFTIAAIGFAQLVLAAVVALPVALNYIPLSGLTSISLDLARWALLLVLVMMALSICYRYGPSHSRPRWRWISWGSVSAAVLWLAVSIAFSWYVAHFGSYNKAYGSLGAIIGFMTWIWLSIIVVLVGAELNAEIERRTIR
jgi:membrane protein